MTASVQPWLLPKTLHNKKGDRIIVMDMVKLSKGNTLELMAKRGILQAESFRESLMGMFKTLMGCK
jgi:hypothetical protein